MYKQRVKLNNSRSLNDIRINLIRIKVFKSKNGVNGGGSKGYSVYVGIDWWYKLIVYSSLAKNEYETWCRLIWSEN